MKHLANYKKIKNNNKKTQVHLAKKRRGKLIEYFVTGRHLADKRGTESKKKKTKSSLLKHKCMLLDDTSKSPPTLALSFVHSIVNHTPELRLTGLLWRKNGG